MPIRNQVILYLTHRISKSITNEYTNIRSAVEGIGDVFFVYHEVPNISPCHLEAIDNRYKFTDNSLSALDYPVIGGKMIPGHCHFPLLQFFRDHSDYDYYWIVEYDVRFSGEWRFFFDSFSVLERDYLACHIRGVASEPEWPYWWLYHPEKSIPIQNRFRSFNPIYRLSRAALEFMDRALREGWCGHQEVILPTLLFNNGFTMMDFGGSGKFTLPGMENRFYIDASSNARGDLTSGTMRWRPVFWGKGREPNKLYHPVKPLPFFLLENLSYYLERCPGVQRFFKQQGAWP